MSGVPAAGTRATPSRRHRPYGPCYAFTSVDERLKHPRGKHPFPAPLVGGALLASVLNRTWFPPVRRLLQLVCCGRSDPSRQCGASPGHSLAPSSPLGRRCLETVPPVDV